MTSPPHQPQRGRPLHRPRSLLCPQLCPSAHHAHRPCHHAGPAFDPQDTPAAPKRTRPTVRTEPPILRILPSIPTSAECHPSYPVPTRLSLPLDHAHDSASHPFLLSPHLPMDRRDRLLPIWHLRHCPRQSRSPAKTPMAREHHPPDSLSIPAPLAWCSYWAAAWPWRPAPRTTTSASVAS